MNNHPTPRGPMRSSELDPHHQTSLTERALASRWMPCCEQVRRQFAAELHDLTSANLAALRLNLALVMDTAAHARNTLVFTDCLADTWALLEDTNAGIRDLCQDLHPPAFGQGGLATAVQHYAQVLHRRTGLPVQVACKGPLDLPHDLELTLFRMIQEALTNAIKHAHATAVTVTLQRHAQALYCSVADNGVGFDAAGMRPEVAPSGGHGLHHMYCTAGRLGALLLIDSAPGSGTRISLELPHAGTEKSP